MWQVEATARRNYMSIEWNEQRLARLKELCLVGCGNIEISETLETEFSQPVSVKSVEQAKYRNRFTRFSMVENFDVPIFKSETLPDDNYMISCDYHSPYHSPLWINRYLAIAELFKIRKSIVIGDLFDMEFAKHWYSPNMKSLDEEVEEAQPVIQALDYFDENVLICGNHESRPGRMTDGKIQAKHLYHLFGKEIWDKKFKYTEYDKMWIGDKWLLVHPRSYSQISPSVAKRLAEKFHCNIINSHGHLIGMTYDRSGRYLAVDLGGMFDIQRIEYTNMNTTTHPVWSCGFGMIRDGKFWHFNSSTDWSFWLQ